MTNSVQPLVDRAAVIIRQIDGELEVLRLDGDEEGHARFPFVVIYALAQAYARDAVKCGVPEEYRGEWLKLAREHLEAGWARGIADAQPKLAS